MTSALAELKVGTAKTDVLDVLERHGIRLTVDSKTGHLQDRSITPLSYVREEWVTHFYFSEESKLTDIITEVHFQSDERDIRRLGG